MELFLSHDPSAPLAGETWPLGGPIALHLPLLSLTRFPFGVRRFQKGCGRDKMRVRDDDLGTLGSGEGNVKAVKSLILTACCLGWESQAAESEKGLKEMEQPWKKG